MARLRAPGGCPWDREQTFDTIKPYMLEETYEVLDAIDAATGAGLAEELGRPHAAGGLLRADGRAKQDRFSIADSLDAINEKLVRRHPHVFGDGDAKTPDQVLARWDEIKVEEKREKGEQPKGRLDGVPRALPALMEAHADLEEGRQGGLRLGDVRTGAGKAARGVGELAQARAAGLAGRDRGRGRRPAVHAGQRRALAEGRSGAGAAQDQRQVPDAALRTSKRSPDAAGQHVEQSTLAGDGVAVAAGQDAVRNPLRPLDTSPSSGKRCELQKEIWGFEDIELLPLRLFVVAHKVGGQVFGAFDSGTQAAPWSAFCWRSPD